MSMDMFSNYSFLGRLAGEAKVAADLKNETLEAGKIQAAVGATAEGKDRVRLYVGNKSWSLSFEEVAQLIKELRESVGDLSELEASKVEAAPAKKAEKPAKAEEKAAEAPAAPAGSPKVTFRDAPIKKITPLSKIPEGVGKTLPEARVVEKASPEQQKELDKLFQNIGKLSSLTAEIAEADAAHAERTLKKREKAKEMDMALRAEYEKTFQGLQSLQSLMIRFVRENQERVLVADPGPASEMVPMPDWSDEKKAEYDRLLKNRADFEASMKEVEKRMKELAMTEFKERGGELKRAPRLVEVKLESSLEVNAAEFSLESLVNKMKDLLSSGKEYLSSLGEAFENPTEEVEPEMAMAAAKIQAADTYEYVVQGNYGKGWEDVSAYETREEANQGLKEYNENETQYRHRVIRRKEMTAAKIQANEEEKEYLCRRCGSQLPDQHAKCEECEEEKRLAMRPPRERNKK